MKRKDKHDPAEYLETDDSKKPLSGARAAGKVEPGDPEEKGNPRSGAEIFPEISEEILREVDEEKITLRGDHAYPLDAVTHNDFPGLSESSEVVMDEIDRYTDDDDVLADFAERQMLKSGRDELRERLEEHHSNKPDLSAGDIDARWEDADVSGEETVGGTVVTPDQDIVEEIGEALGIEYSDDEPLATEDKLNARDRNRWELSPSSMGSDSNFDDDDLEALLEDDQEDDQEDELELEDLDLEDDSEEEEDDEEDDLEEDLEDEFPDEIEDELEMDLENLEEDEDIDEDDAGYDLEDLEDDLDEDLDEFLDEDFDEDDDDY